MSTRIALIDDHVLFRQGLTALLDNQPDFEVVAQASDAEEGYQALEGHPVDLVIVDLSLPGSNGVAVTRELRRRAPETKILILSAHTAHDWVKQALSAGASGYALKEQDAEGVIEAIGKVMKGERYLAPSLPATLLEAHDHEGQLPLETLSPREQEIFALVARGFSSEAIGTELRISVKTVETHRAHINRKLGLHSTAEIIRFAARHGLLTD